ncbi:hypothetical protein DFH06DRAFT_1358390 [Mycena polygramma]|nr:hypothetical protein DFH06DRAFT_1358390 [Mycena polygramma]
MGNLTLASYEPRTPNARTPPSVSPRKAKTTSPGIRKRQKEWTDSLPALWVKQQNFRHPSGTWTVIKAIAEKFPLNKREIGTLPYEDGVSVENSFQMKLYAYDQLVDLATRKCAKLGIPLRIPDCAPQSLSRSPGADEGSVIPVDSRTALPWEEHVRNPQPPPLRMSQYIPPPNMLAPDPEKIAWLPRGLQGPVTVKDACRMYLIKPEEITDLSNFSPWVDLCTVAQRAVRLHGGFYAHKELHKEQAFLEKAGRDQSDFTFSPFTSDQLKWHASNAHYYVTPDSQARQNALGECVELFFPIIKVPDGDSTANSNGTIGLYDGSTTVRAQSKALAKINEKGQSWLSTPCRTRALHI